MDSRDDFETMGKGTTYRVPDDFFDTITDQTLEKARVRQRSAERRIFITRISAAAVVMVIVIFSVLNTGIFLRPQEQGTVVQAEGSRVPEVPGSIPEIFPDSVSVVDEQIQGESNRGSASTFSEAQSEESIESLLASLSEEELFALAEQISAEILLNEIIEE